MKKILAQIPLIRTICAAELNRLSSVSRLVRFRKGEALFKEGSCANFIWLIQHGWVYLVRRTPQGVPVTICTVTPEEMLCGFSAVIGQSNYYASAIAATDTTAICIPFENFAKLLRAEPNFTEKVLAIYHTRMRHMAESISLAQAPVEQRLAYTLLRLKATFGATIPVTHQELSRMAGIRWETSIRTLADFKRKRWLKTRRGKMTVLHPERLKALLRSRHHK